MATLAEIRQQYPGAYDDLSDAQLADALYQKHYSDMPRADFDAKMGVAPKAEAPLRTDATAATARGIINGVPIIGPALLEGTLRASALASSLLDGKDYKQALEQARGYSSAAAREFPGTTTAAELGGGVLGTIPAAVAAPAAFGAGAASLPVRSAVSALTNSAIGGADAAVRSEGNVLQDAATGAAINAAGGAVAPGLASGVSAILRRLGTPFATTPQRTAAAQFLDQEGVPLTAGQRTGSKGLRYAESEIGGNTAEDIVQRQGEAFTDAAMRRAGSTGLATPDNLATLQRNLGREFEGISARNTLRADPQFGQDIGTTLNRYGRLLEAQQRPIIDNITDDVLTRIRANNGALPGPEYQAIRSDLSTAAKSTSNQALAGAFRGIRNALDNAMERTLQAANSPDLARWGTLRRQYGNMKVLQRASLGGGEDAGMGIISPARLRMAAASGNQTGYSTGASDFTQLAKAGQAVMTPLPNSGTPGRLRAQNLGMSFLPTIVGSAGGSAYGANQDGARGAVLGALGGAMLPRAAGRVMMSRPAQAYLSNQRWPNGMSPVSQAIANLLAARMASGAIAAE